MKRKLLFILPLIILSFGYFNLKCIPNVAKMPYYFQLGFDSNVTTWNILLLNEYGKFVDFSKITDGLLRPLSFVNLYGDPPEFDKTKLNHTVLVKYTINNQAYNDTLDIYTKLEYDNYRQQDQICLIYITFLDNLL